MKDTKTFRCLTPDCPNVNLEITVRGKRVKSVVDFDSVEGKSFLIQKYEAESRAPRYITYPQMFCAHCGLPPMEVN